MSDSGTPWTIAYQAALSMDFPGKNTGVGYRFPLQEIFPDLPSALAGGFFTTEPPGKPINIKSQNHIPLILNEIN